jgi:hypothetical protein
MGLGKRPSRLRCQLSVPPLANFLQRRFRQSRRRWLPVQPDSATLRRQDRSIHFDLIQPWKTRNSIKRHELLL